MANSDRIDSLPSVIAETAASVQGHTRKGNISKSKTNYRVASAAFGMANGRTAQMYSTPGTNYTSPNFYTPFTTPSAFQIPNNRKEVYLWSQWWFDSEPKVAAAIEFYTDYPVSDFQLECPNGYVKEYFEKLIKKLKLRSTLPQMSQEYHLRGDVFICLTIECETCQGLNVDDHGDECDHSGATWKSMTILNPDQVESSGYFLDEEPLYYFIPDDNMIKVVQDGKPKELYDKIPDQVRKLILSKQPIYLDPISITHLKRGSAPWQPYGTGMVRRSFGTLAYKDKLRQAQWLVAERHIVPIKVVKIGSENRPASSADIEAVQEELTNIANDPLLTLVTHHNFDFDFIGAAGKVLTLTNEYELIDQEINDGFGINKGILNGEGASYSNAQVGLLVLAKKFDRLRAELSEFIEEKIFKPVALWNGFVTEGKSGEEEVIYPTIKWGDLELRDETNKLQLMSQANKDGKLSTQTYIETLIGPNSWDQEVERLRFENTANILSNNESGNVGGGYGGSALGGGAPDMGGMGGLGGMPTGGADMGGSGEESPAGGAGEMGGGEMPQLASTQGNESLYRFASQISNGLYNERMENFNLRFASKNGNGLFKSAAHEDFIKSQPIVTGRGYCGLLPEEPNIIYHNVIFTPIDGGMFCTPLNQIAAIEMNNQRIAAKKDEDQRPKMFFSTLEQKLYNLLIQANIPYAFYAQYQPGIGLYQLDAAFPAIKLGVEADSRTFHNNPDKIAQDRQRDITLATQGWTVLRFTEEEINQQPQEIVNAVVNTIKKITSNNQNITI